MRFAFVCLSVLFLSNSKEPCCTQKYAIKKDAGTRPSFPFSRAILKHMCLLYGKTHRCWWNPRLVEVPHVHALASWNVLWTVIFWLINLSDGFILLIFVLDLGLDNMFFSILFLNYMFPIKLGICGLWICSSKNIVFLYKISFQNIEKSVGRTFSFQLCLNFRW